MTASDILSIVVTVAVVQGICDLLAYWRVYSSEAYDRALEKRSRALFRQSRAQKEADAAKEKEEQETATITTTTTTKTAGNKNTNKPSNKVVRVQKTLERAQQDLADANANVARFSIMPNFGTSAVFVILMRVMGTEHAGKIMGLLPFVPFQMLHKITGRGLDFGTVAGAPLEGVEEKADVRHVMQACSFVFVYFLAGLSVKFYISRLLGVRVPGGADTMMSLTQSTWGQKFLRAAGVDPDELKMD